VDNEKKMGKNINACEMWLWSHGYAKNIMDGEKTNESVCLEIVTEEDEMLQQTAIRRKLGFFGHVMQSDGLEKGMMLLCGEGRRRGLPWRRWMDEIHKVRPTSTREGDGQMRSGEGVGKGLFCCGL